jgi:arsenite/tail-anchored protein-transporting ATPase
VVLVARPDQGALTVAADAAGQLHELGIDHQTLVINGVLAEPLAGDVVAEAYAAAQQHALSTRLSSLHRLPVAVVPLVAGDLIGVAALRAFVMGPARPRPATVTPGPPR